MTPQQIYGLITFCAGIFMSAIIIGWFNFIKDTPKRSEVEKMIMDAMSSMRKDIAESLEQSRKNTTGINDIQLSLAHVDGEMKLINNSFGYLTKMVIDDKLSIHKLAQGSDASMQRLEELSKKNR